MDLNSAVNDFYRYHEIINTDTELAPCSSIRLPSKDQIDREKLMEYFKTEKGKEFLESLKNLAGLISDYKSHKYEGAQLKKFSSKIEELFNARDQIKELPLTLRLTGRTVDAIFNKPLDGCKADRISIGYIDRHYSLILMDKNEEHIFKKELGYRRYKEKGSVKAVFDSLRYFCNTYFPVEEILNPEEEERKKKEEERKKKQEDYNFFISSAYIYAPRHILLSALHLLNAEETNSEKSADFLEDIFDLAKIRIMKTKSFLKLKSKLDDHLSDSHKNTIHTSKQKLIEDFLEKNKFEDLRIALDINLISPREIAELSALLLIYIENISNDIEIRNNIISTAFYYIKNTSVYKRFRYDFENNNSSSTIEEYLEKWSFLKLKNKFAEEVESRDLDKKNKYDSQLKSIYGSN